MQPGQPILSDNAKAVVTEHQGLCFYGKVTTFTDANNCKIAGLSGYGDDFFVGYYIWCVRDAGGSSAAPQGEREIVTDYTSTDGALVHNAFTANLAVDDEVLLVHPVLIEAIATVIAKTDLLNSAADTSTLNDANPSDTIVPSSLPTNLHVIFDISNLNNANDDFTLEVKVGVSGSERVVSYYKLTSDGADITADTGSGTGAKIKQRRIDISDILVYTGEQVLLNYTKNSATDRNVPYKYVCGV